MAAAKNAGFTIDCSHFFDGIFDNDDDVCAQEFTKRTNNTIDKMFASLGENPDAELVRETHDRAERQLDKDREAALQMSRDDKLLKGGIAGGAMLLAGFCFHAWATTRSAG
jgi:hypothetical protein